VNAGGINDLFVLSHGWNNGVNSARDLYQAMFGLLAAQLGTHLPTSAAVGVICSSLLFPDDDPATAPPVPSTGAQLTAALAPAIPSQQQQLNTMGQSARPAAPGSQRAHSISQSGERIGDHAATGH
jgi:hypothetical protein